MEWILPIAVVMLVVAYPLVRSWFYRSELNPSEDTVPERVQQKIPQNSVTFKAVYRRNSGHKRLDYYLRDFRKMPYITGYLANSPEGLYFAYPTYKAAERVLLRWLEIRSIAIENSNWFTLSELQITSSQYSKPIRFIVLNPKTVRLELVQRLEAMRKQKVVERELEITHIQNRNLTAISASAFELEMKHLLQVSGYRVQHVGKSGDHGIDLVCRDDEDKKVVVQCKQYTNKKVTEPMLRDFYGTLMSENASYGLFITTSDFTVPALRWSDGKPIKLVNKNKLAMWYQHIFDS